MEELYQKAFFYILLGSLLLFLEKRRLQKDSSRETREALFGLLAIVIGTTLLVLIGLRFWDYLAGFFVVTLIVLTGMHWKSILKYWNRKLSKQASK